MIVYQRAIGLFSDRHMERRSENSCWDQIPEHSLMFSIPGHRYGIRKKDSILNPGFVSFCFNSGEKGSIPGGSSVGNKSPVISVGFL